VLLGSGSGVFQAHADTALSAAPQSVLIADFNQNGRLDVAVAIPLSNGISVLAQ
jgi:hypothetical protein